MSIPIVIELAGPPQGKGRARVTRSGIAFTPKATRSYETALRWAAQVAMRGAKPLEGPLQLLVRACMPIPTSWSKRRQRLAAANELKPTTKPDFDNIAKTCDALTSIVWKDDSQVVDCRIIKAYSDRPRLELTVTLLAETAGNSEAEGGDNAVGCGEAA
jgi:Holliday junction resolvase RusA-like endonuclease